MRYLLILILSILTSLAYTQKRPCTIYGDKPVRKFQVLDSLKNRNTIPPGTITYAPVTLEQILSNKSDDRTLYNSNQYVQLTGYVILVKYGGQETCNCHDTTKSNLDIHIEMALSPSATNKDAMVLEINRYTRSSTSALRDIKTIKALVGKKITVEGYLFLDDEHLQNAVTTNPKGTNLWRYTCWEVHPLLNIKF